MNAKRIHNLLKDALEKEISSREIDLWPAIEAELGSGSPLKQSQGKPMNAIHSNRRLRALLTTGILLALIAVSFLTPAGQSFARSMLNFFTQAEGTSFPLAEEQIPVDVSGSAAPTALPPSPLLSVAEAEAQLGFEIAELAADPEGLEYLGVRLYGNSASLEYQVPGGGGSLLIHQSQESYYQSEWDSVPADEVIPVQIGDLAGEFVQGAFVVHPGEESASWNPDAAILRLRWLDAGMYYQITRYGDTQPIAHIDMEALIRLVEGLQPGP